MVRWTGPRVLWVLVTYNKTAATTALSSDWDGTLWSDAKNEAEAASRCADTPLSDSLCRTDYTSSRSTATAVAIDFAISGSSPRSTLMRHEGVILL